jgi:hypothetical protein
MINRSNIVSQFFNAIPAENFYMPKVGRNCSPACNLSPRFLRMGVVAIGMGAKLVPLGILLDKLFVL